ncbi:uncharacterized protein LOC142527646 isoform X1 [Primulina tabacum]|uniref:uncharacterized protein LOC142527646 isoform X1 n=1 Tax=Primulina tabacum TaxID=48773 RepID=UPI003F593171
MASLFHHSTAQNANTKRVMAFSPRRQKTVGNNECLLHSSLLCEQRAANRVCLLCSLIPSSCSSFVFNPVFPLLAIGKLLPFINEGLLFFKNKITGILLSKGSPPSVTGGTEKQLREERTFAGPINN